MSGKILLKEFFALCPNGICNIDLLTESEKKLKNDGFVILTGILQVKNQKNGNNRIYPGKILEREVERYQEEIRANRSTGEIDHSSEAIINLKNASHMVIRTWWDGDNLMGVIKILKTPAGQIAEGLIKSSVSLGISSRSLGNLIESPQGSIVQDDLQLICWDLVQNASAPGAYLKLQEHKNNNLTLSKPDRIVNMLNDILKVNK